MEPNRRMVCLMLSNDEIVVVVGHQWLERSFEDSFINLILCVLLRFILFLFCGGI